jgi:3-methylfumaryl-CoA hydratase
MTKTIDLAHLETWVGNQEELVDTITVAPLKGLSATLDRHDTWQLSGGDRLPALWHWLYFLTTANQSQLGPDGHPLRGGFLPPVPYPRRMWAGGRLTWHAPILTGTQVVRRSTVQSLRHKVGRSGDLVFVQVGHEMSGPAGLALTEQHDIVYRPLAAANEVAPAPQPSPSACSWHKVINPDPVMLFRYSALTFNGHRIHYDRTYVTEVEGYPGLIVHGPLIATCLVELLVQHLPGRHLQHFEFKALRPTFDTHAFTVRGQLEDDQKTVRLWAEDHEGWLTMQATATLL